MKLPDGTILLHNGKPYDPTKAREYTRSGKELVHAIATKTQPPSNANPSADQKGYLAARVAQIKKDLGTLTDELRHRLDAAEKASVSHSESPATRVFKARLGRKEESLAHKDKTTVSKTQNPASKGTSTASSNSVDKLKEQIKTTKANLKAAVAKQREIATAQKNG